MRFTDHIESEVRASAATRPTRRSALVSRWRLSRVHRSSGQFCVRGSGRQSQFPGGFAVIGSANDPAGDRDALVSPAATIRQPAMLRTHRSYLPLSARPRTPRRSFSTPPDGSAICDGGLYWSPNRALLRPSRWGIAECGGEPIRSPETWRRAEDQWWDEQSGGGRLAS
jgi:hypothetical protein